MSRDINIDNIRPDPDQPRREFDEDRLEELAQSMAQQGQTVPLTVRRVTGAEKHAGEGEHSGSYVLIAGERRWRAAQRLGWDTVRAEVRDADPQEARWLALIENLQREDLSSVEEARAFQHLLHRNDLTQSELAEQVGKSQSYIAQKLRLLKVPPPVSFWIDNGGLTEGHIRQLIRIKDFYLQGATVAYGEDLEREVGGPPEAHRVFLQERPTAVALHFPPFDQFGTTEYLKPAADQFLSYAHDQDGNVEAWVIAAWFYGGAAYANEMSVAELSNAIDELEAILRSQYVRLADFWEKETEPIPPSVEFASSPEGISSSWRGGDKPVSVLTRAEVLRGLWFIQYWGAQGDLRHGGLLEPLRQTFRQQDGESEQDLNQKQIEANRRLIEDSREQVGGQPRCPTTAMNAKSPDGIAWQQLQDRLSELKQPAALG